MAAGHNPHANTIRPLDRMPRLSVHRNAFYRHSARFPSTPRLSHTCRNNRTVIDLPEITAQPVGCRRQASDGFLFATLSSRDATQTIGKDPTAHEERRINFLFHPPARPNSPEKLGCYMPFLVRLTESPRPSLELKTLVGRFSHLRQIGLFYSADSICEASFSSPSKTVG